MSADKATFAKMKKDSDALIEEMVKRFRVSRIEVQALTNCEPNKVTLLSLLLHRSYNDGTDKIMKSWEKAMPTKDGKR